MNNIVFLLNKDLDNKKLAQIIALKSQYWHYDFASQQQWMNDNLNDNDIHAYIEDDTKIIAYLNIVQLKVSIENDSYDMYGIGNVCTDKKYINRGMATNLVNNTNQFIIGASKGALLLCHEPLIQFYDKCGWNNITNMPSSVYVAENKYCLSLMGYNLLADVYRKRVCINRNF